MNADPPLLLLDSDGGAGVNAIYSQYKIKVINITDGDKNWFL